MSSACCAVIGSTDHWLGVDWLMICYRENKLDGTAKWTYDGWNWPLHISPLTDWALLTNAPDCSHIEFDACRSGWEFFSEISLWRWSIDHLQRWRHAAYQNTLPDHSWIKLYVNIQVDWLRGPLIRPYGVMNMRKRSTGKGGKGGVVSWSVGGIFDQVAGWIVLSTPPSKNWCVVCAHFCSFVFFVFERTAVSSAAPARPFLTTSRWFWRSTTLNRIRSPGLRSSAERWLAFPRPSASAWVTRAWPSFRSTSTSEKPLKTSATKRSFVSKKLPRYAPPPPQTPLSFSLFSPPLLLFSWVFRYNFHRRCGMIPSSLKERK